MAPLSTLAPLPVHGPGDPEVTVLATVQAKSNAPAEKNGSVQSEPRKSVQTGNSVPNVKKMELTTIKNDGALREEIEIELLSCEDEKFTGSLTMQEAKHGIYRDCLGFKDFKNFDGVRFAYNGI